jgi:hypothetical protein
MDRIRICKIRKRIRGSGFIKKILGSRSLPASDADPDHFDQDTDPTFLFYAVPELDPLYEGQKLRYGMSFRYFTGVGASVRIDTEFQEGVAIHCRCRCNL